MVFLLSTVQFASEVHPNSASTNIWSSPSDQRTGMEINASSNIPIKNTNRVSVDDIAKSTDQVDTMAFLGLGTPKEDSLLDRRQDSNAMRFDVNDYHPQSSISVPVEGSFLGNKSPTRIDHEEVFHQDLSASESNM